MEETYYIFTDGSLARKDNTLRFVSEDGNKRDLPIENISDIYIFSEINLNISLLNLLSKMGISVHFLTIISTILAVSIQKSRNSQANY